MSTEQVVQWVGQASQGDKTAFEALVETFQRPVCGIAYSVVGDRSVSEDVAQEAFIAAWKGLPSLRSPERFSSWLFAITRNLANSTVRQGIRERRATSAREADRPVPGPDVSAAAEDTADAVWESLEALPPRYREVMVLYYREGESAAAVAEALGISEECVRQRLSRGRRLLRETVAHLVEDVLRSGGPSRAFTGGVIAGLALSGTQMTMAQTTLAAATGGKAVSAAGPGALFGSLAFLAGPIIGMTGGFFGMWASIRNAPTLASRRFMLGLCGYFYGALWLFLGYQFACIAMDLNHQPGILSPIILGWIVYAPALVAFILFTNRRMHRIAVAEFGEADQDRTLVASYTLDRAWRGFYLGLPVALGGSLGLLWMVQTLPGVAWIPAVAVLLFCHGGFALVFRAGARISADEVAFEATAPALGAAEWVSGTNVENKVTPRIQFWNDVGALVGAIFGGTCWLFLLCIGAGAYGLGIGFGVSIVLLLLASLYFRYRSERRDLIYLLSLMGTGIIAGATAWYGWPHFANLDTQLPASSGLLIGLLLFGLYAAVGVGVYAVTRARDSSGSVQRKP